MRHVALRDMDGLLREAAQHVGSGIIVLSEAIFDSYARPRLRYSVAGQKCAVQDSVRPLLHVLDDCRDRRVTEALVDTPKMGGSSFEAVLQFSGRASTRTCLAVVEVFDVYGGIGYPNLIECVFQHCGPSRSDPEYCRVFWTDLSTKS